MSDKGAVLVTGVSRGIGRAMATDFAAQGYHVIGMSRTAPEGGFDGEFHAVDMMDAAATDAALKEIAAKHAVLRVVNNAGMIKVAPSESAPLSDLEAMVALNIRALTQCSQALVQAFASVHFKRFSRSKARMRSLISVRRRVN